nr:thiaminase II [uncultured Acidocella sp.]
MARLFAQWRDGAGAAWGDYVRHPFVQALAEGRLKPEAFRNFLIQDYLFLIQYGRAYALLAAKLEALEDIKAALATAQALIETEMPLHVKYCEGWGITEAQMRAAEPSLEMLAYTRYVLEVGYSGDALALLAALAPCIAGYAEVGAYAAARAGADNLYRPWIETYTGADYLEVVASSLAMIDRVGAACGAAGRAAELQGIFTQATKLEAAFWNTGWISQI